METEFDVLAEEVGTSLPQPGALTKFGCGLDVRSTVVVVDVELGSNHAVFIRGQGCGLSWECGQPLTRVGPTTWIWSAGPLEEIVEFGLLFNDLVWARGEKIVLAPGHIIEITPDFEWPEIPKVANSCVGESPPVSRIALEPEVGRYLRAGGMKTH